MRVPGYCEICKEVYMTNGIGLGEGTVNFNITNATVGTCPIDGGKIRVPNGTYNVKDSIMNFTALRDDEELKEILSVLSNFQYINKKTDEQNINSIAEELSTVTNDKNKIIEWIYKLFSVTNSLDLAIKLVIVLMTTATGIMVEEVVDNLTVSDEELMLKEIKHQNIVEIKNQNKIMKQNEEIINNQNLEKRMDYKERKSKVVSKKKKSNKKKK